MSQKAKHRILISVSLTLGILLVSLSALTVLYFYAQRNLDGELDESLFNMSKGSNATEYYYNATPGGGYTPQVSESIFHITDKKIWYSYEEFPPLLRDAVIAVEDKRFFEHKGVDFKRTALAMANSVFSFKNKFGASTVTQQVIKNISGDNDVSVKRKFREILRALRLEENHSKREILELYLNVVPMGENTIGLGLGAEVYFGKKPRELTASEIATLVGVINAPTRYNPHENPEACRKKRNEVLSVMKEAGIITSEEYENAKNEPLTVKEKSDTEHRISSWFAETVNEDVIDALVRERGISRALAENMVYSGGLSIYTTMDADVQRALEDYFENIANFPEEVGDGLDCAMVIYDSVSGDLLGIVGSVGEKRAEQLLNLATAPHTPGSALKPIALYAPLINSRKINYASVFDDSPVVFNKKGDFYVEYPKNYPNVYSGLTTVKDAIRLSKNTVAVKLYNILGAESIYDSLKNDYDFDTLVRRRVTDEGKTISDLASSPLALGQLSCGVSLRKLTEAYSVFPGEGVYRKGRSFVAVYDGDGKLILENKPTEKRILRKEAARVMNQLLSTVTESGTAAGITLDRLVDTAGKTGTSGEDKDRLFVGYTPYYTAGVWLGYRDSSKPVGKLKKSHLSIWDEVMRTVHEQRLFGVADEDIRTFSTVGLKKCGFCKDSGMLYSDACVLDLRGSRLDVGYFEAGFMPRMHCDRHIPCLYDTETETVAGEKSNPKNIICVSLLRAEERSFPKEIDIADGKYMLRVNDEEANFGTYYLPKKRRRLS